MPGRMLFRYTREEVARHNTPSDLWVIHNNKVYDVTEFAVDHPGGPELIKEWGGKDVTKILVDSNLHEHSDIAYEVLAELCMGEIVEGTSTIESKNTNAQTENNDRDERIIEPFHLQITDVKRDFQRENFLDLNKPLYEQM